MCHLCLILSVVCNIWYITPQALCQMISDEVPNVLEFREYCKKNLQDSDACLGSRLSNVLQHSFFTHEFIRIYVFLEELPLKTDSEREEFFT